MGETEPNSWLPCTLQAHGCGRGHNTMGELVGVGSFRRDIPVYYLARHR